MTDTAVIQSDKPRGPWRDVWAQFRRHRGAMAALVLLVSLAMFVFLGPFVWRYDPNFIESDTVKMFKMRNLGPGWEHPLGTDQLGRDMLARMMFGGRISLAVGLVAMLVAIFIGTTVGVLAGYFRRLDGALMRLTDLFLALPLLPLLLVMIFLFRDSIAGVLGPRADQLDAGRARGAGRGACAEGARIRAGGAIHRHAVAPDHHAAYPAQCAVARAGGGNTGDCGGDHHGIGAELPWPWLSAGFPDMGAAAV